MHHSNANNDLPKHLNVKIAHTQGRWPPLVSMPQLMFTLLKPRCSRVLSGLCMGMSLLLIPNSNPRGGVHGGRSGCKESWRSA